MFPVTLVFDAKLRNTPAFNCSSMDLIFPPCVYRNRILKSLLSSFASNARLRAASIEKDHPTELDVGEANASSVSARLSNRSSTAEPSSTALFPPPPGVAPSSAAPMVVLTRSFSESDASCRSLNHSSKS